MKIKHKWGLQYRESIYLSAASASLCFQQYYAHYFLFQQKFKMQPNLEKFVKFTPVQIKFQT